MIGKGESVPLASKFRLFTLKFRMLSFILKAVFVSEVNKPLTPWKWCRCLTLKRERVNSKCRHAQNPLLCNWRSVKVKWSLKCRSAPWSVFKPSGREAWSPAQWPQGGRGCGRVRESRRAPLWHGGAVFLGGDFAVVPYYVSYKYLLCRVLEARN